MNERVRCFTLVLATTTSVVFCENRLRSFSSSADVCTSSSSVCCVKQNKIKARRGGQSSRRRDDVVLNSTCSDFLSAMISARLATFSSDSETWLASNACRLDSDACLHEQCFDEKARDEDDHMRVPAAAR